MNSKSWSDLGEIPVIPDANNDGLHGLVTGSKEDLKGFIDNNAQISINGLETHLDNKVDKLSTASIVYSTDSYGNQITTGYSLPVAGDSLVLRDAEGNTYSTTPTQPGHTANKQYVDDQISSIEVKTDSTTITKNDNAEIQAIGLTNGTGVLTYEEILEAMTIRKGL